MKISINTLKEIINEEIKKELKKQPENFWRDISKSNTTREKYPTSYGILYSDIEQNRRYAGSQPEEAYVQGTEDNLELADDSDTILVEPEVRKQIRKYLKQMGMIP